MMTQSVTSTAPAAAASAAASAASAASAAASSSSTTSSLGNGLDKDAFLRLLVTQLSNQDPTKPVDDTQFISQMAQFSSLEQMSNVSAGLDTLTQMQLTTQALSLVGRTVTLQNPNGGDPIKGKVDEVKFVQGQPRLVIGDKEYSLSDVMSIS